MINVKITSQEQCKCVASATFFASRNFYVVVVPLKRTSGTVKNLKSPDEMDMEEVLPCTHADDDGAFRYISNDCETKKMEESDSSSSKQSALNRTFEM